MCSKQGLVQRKMLEQPGQTPTANLEQRKQQYLSEQQSVITHYKQNNVAEQRIHEPTGIVNTHWEESSPSLSNAVRSDRGGKSTHWTVTVTVDPVECKRDLVPVRPAWGSRRLYGQTGRSQPQQISRRTPKDEENQWLFRGGTTLSGTKIITANQGRLTDASVFRISRTLFTEHSSRKHVTRIQPWQNTRPNWGHALIQPAGIFSKISLPLKTKTSWRTATD